ncbi:HNH endonuclease signature motif containing protein [Rhodococcus aerolatus]
MFDTIEAGQAQAAGLLSSAAALHRDIARAQHAQVVAVSAFCRLREELDDADPSVSEATAARMRFEAGEFARSEVAVALGVSVVAAGWLQELGDALEVRPALSAAFAAGEVDLARVRVVLEGTAEVHPDRMGAVDEEVTAAARVARGAGLGARVGRIVARVDPEAVRRRRQVAELDRHVQVTPRADGTATVWARLRGHEGLVLDRRLDQLADTLCAADPRTRAQQRADGLVSLVHGTEMGCRCGGCHREAVLPMPRVELIVTGATLAGGDAPGELLGHGPLDPDLTRILAACADTVRVATTARGTVLDTQAVRYTPSAALAATIRLRDRTCRFPGCRRRATQADLDHLVPFRHDDPTRGGLTVWDNLFALCRHHHRAKTLRVWTYHHLGDAVLEWTSPTGTTRTTRPPPAPTADDPPPF